MKENFPDATYSVREWEGRPFLHDDVLGYLVETSLTVDGETLTMRLPVMDGSNKAQKSVDYDYVVRNPNFKFAMFDPAKGVHVDKFGNVQTEFITKHVAAATMFDINTAIMRCLVKNMAMFGLGHYIYAGEDLPSTESYKTAEAAQQGAEDYQAAQREAEVMHAKFDEGVRRMQECKTIDELQKVFTEYPVFAQDKAFRRVCNSVGNRIKLSSKAS